MPQKTAAEIAYEAQKRATGLFTGECPYTLEHHYHLNINNTVLNAFYEDTIKRHKLGHPPFDDKEKNPQRQNWESSLWEFLRGQYMEYEPKYARMLPKELPRDEHISGKVFGWLEDFFKTFINYTMDVPKALELFAKADKTDYKKGPRSD